MQTIEELIAVMTSYKEGKTIQCADLGRDNWEDCEDPRWEWGRFDYRVKPEPKIRPYANAKEFVKAMRKHGPYLTREGNQYKIASSVFDDIINFEATWVSYEGLVELDYKWQDGTPCGIEEGGNV